MERAAGYMPTFNCWVVLVDEMALDQLNRETRFTNTTSTDNHQLVFSQELPTISQRDWTERKDNRG